MEKYTEQTKLAAVEAYCAGQGGWVATAKDFAVSVSSLRKWVAGYQANGVAGVRTKRRELYSLEFKIEVLRRARDEGLSNRQAAALFDIRKFNIIAVWERAYAAHGMAGLEPRRRGRREQAAQVVVPEAPPAHGEDSERSSDELLCELNFLRAENAYLKKVNALVRAQATSAQSKRRKS